MKDYKSYMDRVSVSDELHHKLLDLESVKKERTPMKWKKYAAAAACAALLLGVGAVMRHTGQNDPANYPVGGGYGPSIDWEQMPSAAPVPSQGNAEIAAIDIAPEDPNELEPGMRTIEGYEVRENRAGLDLVRYYVLPWIDYGDVAAAAQVAADWDIPQNATRRDLTADEIVSLLGGEDGVDVHLDWSGYELTGWAAWYEDGSFWGAYLQGYKGPMDHFTFAVTAGQLPPTCIHFPESVEQEIWGVTVTADKHDGQNGCSRRVSFMKDDYGYRFDLTATVEPEAAEKLVSRAVAYVAVGDGLSFYTVTGEEPPAAKPAPASGPAPSVGPTEASTPAYDPSKG